MNRKSLLKRLKELNIIEAVVDKFASADGSPAILLRWNGKEEYYTGHDEPNYEVWVKETFGNK